MYGKMILLISALAFGNPARGGELAKDLSGHEKSAAAKATPAGKKESQSQEIKPAGKGEKCKAHDAAKADCFICDPAKREKGRMWCKEHDRYEDRCFICHPELKDAKRMWCKEHNLYEDECFLCHPELKKETKGKQK